MATKGKRKGLGLDIRMFDGKEGESYIVFKTTKGSYHVFKEVEAKQAALQCGSNAEGNTNTRQMWGTLWKQ
ncbi:MAG: hypothetical protein WD851_14455 [Pirellulales bacterium]